MQMTGYEAPTKEQREEIMNDYKTMTREHREDILDAYVDLREVLQNRSSDVADIRTRGFDWWADLVDRVNPGHVYTADELRRMAELLRRML